MANKSEDGFEGEILSDFYRKLPQMKTAVDPITEEPYEPIFISAEHGDGLPDLFRSLRLHIPPEREQQYEERKEKRVIQFEHYKSMLLDEIVQMKTEEIERDEPDIEEQDYAKELEAFVKSWEKEFDFIN